jgi:hypothetical protein
MLKQAARGKPLLEHLFGGAVRSVDKIEAGQPFIAAKGTLQAIIHQQQRRRMEAGSS